MKRRYKIGIGLAAVVLFLLLLDYIGYVHDERWYAKLTEDLPIGTPMDEVRIYLKDEGKKHGITGLWEDERPDMRGFVFDNHNNSIVTRSINNGFDWLLLFGGVAVRFDENERLNEIYIFK